MGEILQLRGGTTAEHSTFTGASREVTIDTDKNTVVVHDGSTVGGTTLAPAATTLNGYGITDAYTKTELDSGQLDNRYYTEAEVDAAIAANPSIAMIASSVLTNTKQTFSIDNFVVTKNFVAYTYTGNGTSQSIVTGINSVDFTVDASANCPTLRTCELSATYIGQKIFLDRSTNQIKICTGEANAGQVITGKWTADWGINKGVSKLEFKNLDQATEPVVYDGLRGVSKYIRTDSTQIETTELNGLTGFTSTGFTLGSWTSVNSSTRQHVVYQTLYTHLSGRETSQGKLQVEAYNPVSGKFMIYTIGSGNGGNEITSSVDDIVYVEIKRLSTTTGSWIVKTQYLDDGDVLLLNDSAVPQAGGSDEFTISDNKLILGSGSQINASNEEYIIYGSRKSDTYDVFELQSTSSEDTKVYDTKGNYLFTADNGVFASNRYLIQVETYQDKLVRVIAKGLNAVSGWQTLDYVRGWSNYIFLNDSIDEQGTSGYKNVLASSTDSFFNYVTDDSNANITNGNFKFSNGEIESGYDLSTEQVTGTIDFTGVSDGLKWVSKIEGGSYNFYENKPHYGLYYKESATDNRLVMLDGKWYNTTGDELLVGTDFTDGSVGDWTAIGCTISVENQQLKVVGTATNDQVYQGKSTVIGETYVVEVSQSVASSLPQLWIGTTQPDGTTLGSEIYSSEASELSSDTVKVEFVALTTTTYITLQVGGGTSLTTYWDNLTFYKKEATLGSALTTPESFIKHPIMVASETPQYIDYNQELSENVSDSHTFTGLVDLSENRKVAYIGTIFNDDRLSIALTDIFGFYTKAQDYDAKAEIFINGEWADAGWRPYSGNIRGVNGGIVNDEVIIKAGKHYVANDDTGESGGLHSSSITLTEAPCRVIVTYIGETKDA